MVDKLIQQVMEEQHVPGIAVAIKRASEDVTEYYRGFSNLEHDVQVTSETIFEIASVTKLFTAQAILILVQNGEIRLEESIATYLDDLPSAWHNVTVQHCLAHQSGIPSYTDVEAYWKMTRDDKSHEDILALIRNLSLKFEPGARHAYDNSAFYLLGLVIEAVSGQAYGDFLNERIFIPLQMFDTQTNKYSTIIPNRCQGYTYQNDVLSNKVFYSTTNTFSAGILLSTVRDLMRWQYSLFDDRILTGDLRQKWWTPHLSAEGNERQMSYSVGLGWFIVDTPMGQFYGHNGSIPGFSASFLHFPDIEVSTAVLCNAGHVTEPHKVAIQLIQQFIT